MKSKIVKGIKGAVATNWKTTLFGLLSGAAVGYAGYTSGNPELMLAGAGMILQGGVAKDSGQ
jgi:hypothetical protein